MPQFTFVSNYDRLSTGEMVTITRIQLTGLLYFLPAVLAPAEL